MNQTIDVIFPAICLTVALTFLIQIKGLVLGEISPEPLIKQQKTNNVHQSRAESTPNFTILRRKITYGDASLHDVLQALTDNDTRSLANTVHALYGMRIHRGVIHALDGLWKNDIERYPEFAWSAIKTDAVRIAIASTLNRIRIVETDEYLNFIRSKQNSDNSFNLAQVCIALGINGAPQDLDFLKRMAAGEDHYVAQSAITALSLFGGNRARDTLIDLAKSHRGSSRGDLITELLRKAYDWPPPELNPLSN